MDVSKIKSGQLIAAVGGIVLLVAMFIFDWYKVGGVAGEAFEAFGRAVGSSEDTGFKAWDSAGFLGVIANFVILAAAIAAVGLAALTATSRTVALPVATSALTAGLGIGAVVMVVLRILFRPGGGPGADTDLKFGIFVALVGAAAVAFGGWRSMQEEGTTFDQAKDQLQDRFGGGEGPSGGGGGGTPPGPGATPPPGGGPSAPPPGPSG